MKRILALAMVCLSFGTMAQLKIGFVDTQRLLDTMPSRKVALTKYQEHEKSLAEEVKAMDAELQKLAADYQAKVGDMTPVIRQAVEKKLNDKQQQLEARYQNVQQELQAYSEELNIPILSRINKAIQIISERQKLSLVVDQSTTLYFDPAMDITTVVAVELLKLEKEAK